MLQGEADWRHIISKLTSVGCLDYVFDLAEIVEGNFSATEFVDLIISAFKEAISTRNFSFAFKLYQKYNLILKLNQIEVTPFLV